MKRLLFAFSLLTAAFTVASFNQATAQTTVTQAAFTAKINQMDTYITAGDVTNADLTFKQLNTMMISVLGVTKQSIYSATTPADKTYYTNYLNTQQIPIYRAIWLLKTDLVTNHAAIDEKLNQFDVLIY